MKSKKQPGKRILKVVIKKMVDESPDTSYLGEYSSRATSECSIDREHAEDCASIEHNHAEALTKLERILGHLETWHDDALNVCDCASRSWYGAEHDSACPCDGADVEALDAAYSEVKDAQSDVAECDCGGCRIGRGEYQYFNPSFNYVKKDGTPNGLTPEEVRKYTRQDYERMESLNAGNWCYLGIRAEAEIGIPQGSPHPKSGQTYLLQTLTSGGLWGIESDSEAGYIREEQQNQLAELKTVLSEFGFSKRAISQAFKPENIRETEA